MRKSSLNFRPSMLWSFLLLTGMLFPFAAFADTVAAVAPANPWADLLAQLNLPQLLKGMAGILVGALMSPVLQATLEHTLMNILPGWATPFKSFIPMIVSFAFGKIAVILGVDPTQAYLAATSLAGGAHLVNESGLGADANLPDPPADPAKAPGEK